MKGIEQKGKLLMKLRGELNKIGLEYEIRKWLYIKYQIILAVLSLYSAYKIGDLLFFAELGLAEWRVFSFIREVIDFLKV